jgi:Dual specificity phosphatase, catalytic domain
VTTPSTEPAATEPKADPGPATVTVPGWAPEPVSAGYTLVGVSILDDYILLGDAGLAMAMVGAGAERLVDLRGETKPPGLPIQIDHFPLIDLEPGQDDLIAEAGAHIFALAQAGTRVGIYCQAGVSRTAAVAIAYLLLGGATLEDATALVRRIRPQAMPAVELRKSLERIAARAAAAAAQE